MLQRPGELFDQMRPRLRMMPAFNFRQIRLRDGPPFLGLNPRRYLLLGEPKLFALLAHHR